MARRGFTLIELLVVMAILAILAAVLFPVFAAAKGVAYQYQAMNGGRQITQASLMYVADNEETFMPAMYVDETVAQAWFGRWMPMAGRFDPEQSLIATYKGRTKVKDPTFSAKDYLGDQSGYGYNWGYIGSDFNITMSYSGYPSCENMAKMSELKNPSSTILFATSGIYSAKWDGGDGAMHDLGFIDPIGMRPNNPNVDFRHLTPKVYDDAHHRVVMKGNATVAFPDGSGKVMSLPQMKDSMFYR